MAGAGEANACHLRDWLRGRIADVTGVATGEVGDRTPLRDCGLSSRDAVMIAGELDDLLDTEVPATLVWEHSCIDEIAERLTAPDRPLSADTPAVETRGHAKQHADQNADQDAGAIAVVGIGCRLPGADGPEEFWDMLVDGRDAIGLVPEGRWEQFVGSGADSAGGGVPGDAAAALARLPRRGGFLPDVSGFDAEFFGITPREAALMDPQQRLLLEVTWEALEHAGIPPESLRGSATGVFVGLATQDYGQLTASDLAQVDAWTSTGISPSIAANRISYILDLRGPSVTLDTACSASLVGVHQACQSLRAEETETALVGGVNMLLSPTAMANFALGGALAADGKCKAFDAAADGIVRAEGCGVVVLKRLDDARRDGDRVLAVLRGSAVNSDGRSNGLTAPNPAAQRELLRAAHRGAATSPSELDYVEAHGTGTLLGDPIEASALGAVLGAGRPSERPLLLGSVKTNIGHLEAAAGIAGLIKVVLGLVHDRIPPGLHFHAPNPHIPFDELRLKVLTEPTPWPRYGGLARAGVSGFGFGGTNAHVVVEENRYPALPERRPSGRSEPGDVERGDVAERTEDDVVVLSARSEPRLRDAAAALAEWLESPRGHTAEIRAVAATMARRRSAHAHRAAIVADDHAELLSSLRTLAAGSPGPEVLTGEVRPDGRAPVWVFSGYGSQWAGMGVGLLADEPAFADRIDELDAYFPEHAGFSLRKMLENGERIEDLERAQLVIFGMQLGLAALWRSLGVQPNAVIGHSMGEVAAAVVAGGVSTEDGVRIMATRSRLLASLNDLGGGAMAAVELSVDELTSLEQDYPEVAVAVDEAPGRLTVTGDAEQVRALVQYVDSLGRTARVLPVRGAGHSAAVDPILDELRDSLAGVAARPADVPCYTSVLDDPRAEPTFDADYWAAGARRSVRFRQAVAAALDDGHTTFLEISPHPLTAGAIVRTATDGDLTPTPTAPTVTPVVAISSRRGHDEARTVRVNLGRLFCAGAAIDWQSVYPAHDLVDLPRTRWQHQSHWFRSDRVGRKTLARGADNTEPDPVLGVRVRLPEGGWLWQAERPTSEVSAERCLTLVTAAADASAPSALSGASRSFGGEVQRSELREFTWHAPPALGETTLLTTTLSETGEGATAVVRATAPSTPSSPSDGPGGQGQAHGDPSAQAWHTIATATIQFARQRSAVPAADRDTGSTSAAAGQRARILAAAEDPVAARHMLGEHVRTVVADIMGFAADRLSADIPLAELGLDSLMLMRIKHVVEHDLDIPEVVPAALRGATLDDVIEHLADLLGLSRIPAHSVLDDGTVRVLRGTGPRTPLVLFHPAGGSCDVYRPLTDALGADVPVYGFDRIERADLASRVELYVELLRSVQPHGPYRLGGWSFGGALAYQAACELTAAGERVELVAMIDTMLPLPDSHDDPRVSSAHRFLRFARYVAQTYGADLRLELEELAELPPDRQIELVMARAEEAGPGMSHGALKHQRDSFVDTLSAEQHTPPRYRGRVVLYRAEEPETKGAMLEPRYNRLDPAAGWEEFCDQLDVVPVSGNHLSVIDPPHVHAIARHLDTALDPASGTLPAAGPRR